MTAEEFQVRVENAAAAFASSRIAQNDEMDEMETDLCMLVPEAQVSMLIGKGGANINTIKAVSGAMVSFAKKENSMHGLRKCFHSGTLGAVIKAAFINVVLVGEAQAIGGSSCSVGILVTTTAAGSVIGKGGENLKKIREETGCHVNMEKKEEAIPAFGGRQLTLRHDQSAPAIAQAIYSAMRVPGFSSLSFKDDRALASQVTPGYGPAGRVGGAQQRFSPYGARVPSGPDVCSLHGKKRGRQNLQPSPTMPGQYVCLDHDQCKGSAGAAAAMDPMAGMAGLAAGYGALGGMGGMGGMGMDMGQGYAAAMGGMMGGMGGMGGMGMGGMGGMGGGMDMYGVDMSTVCAVHNKKRGSRNLQPHPSQPGLYTCMEHDPCKGAGGAGFATAGNADSANTCGTHGKRRGARNLQPHPSTPGLFVCLDDDQCK